ncbi:Ig lambda chain C region [Trichomycterus rosablanca]|uniref:Ig lambda chain C region n=1 Tax=Trichomycterus rosablanca TaxID=2290929 RepID=UPI002F35B749
MRADTLLTSLLLLWLSHGESDQIMYSFSRGVELIVRNTVQVTTVSPKVQILLPAVAEIKTSRMAMLTCIVSDVNTPQIRITWKVNNATVAQKHCHSNVFKAPDGMFTAFGFYSVTARKWKLDDIYKCEVKQGQRTYYEEIRPSHCDNFVKF